MLFSVNQFQTANFDIFFDYADEFPQKAFFFEPDRSNLALGDVYEHYGEIYYQLCLNTEFPLSLYREWETKLAEAVRAFLGEDSFYALADIGTPSISSNDPAKKSQDYLHDFLQMEDKCNRVTLFTAATDLETLVHLSTRGVAVTYWLSPRLDAVIRICDLHGVLLVAPEIDLLLTESYLKKFKDEGFSIKKWE